MHSTTLIITLTTLLLIPIAEAAEPLQLDCVIEPHRLIEVSSSVPGVLEEVLVERNERVSKGQLLAHLQSGVEQANVALARKRATSQVNLQDRETRYRLTLRSQQRIEELGGDRMVSDVDLDEARTKTEVARFEIEKASLEQELDQLELARAEEALKLRAIRSPVDGIVVERLKSAGEYVEQTPVVVLAQIDPLNVEAIADVELYGRIHEGMSARVLPEQPIGGEYRAAVTIVDQVLDAASGTFGIRLRLPNADHQIPAGLGCRLEFADE